MFNINSKAPNAILYLLSMASGLANKKTSTVGLEQGEPGVDLSGHDATAAIKFHRSPS